MSKLQRLVLIGFICSVLLMILLPPVHIDSRFNQYSTVWNPQVVIDRPETTVGYGLTAEVIPAHEEIFPADIRYMQLLIQLIGASLVAFAGYMLARK